MRSQNAILAFLSLALSIGLWAYVRTEVAATEDELAPGTFRVEVNLPNAPSDFILPARPKIFLRADGPQSDIDRLSQLIQQDDSQLQAWVDLSNSKPGKNSYPIEILTPKGFPNVKWKYPKDVSLDIDQTLTKEFKVEVEPQGTPPEGFISMRQETYPKTVSITGRASEIGEIQRARVRLDLSQLNPGSPRENMIGTVELLKSGDVVLSNLTPNPAKVTVLPGLTIKPSVTKLLVSPVLTGQPAPGYKVVRIEVEPNQVTVHGPSEVLAKTISLDTKPIDISGVKENKTFPVDLQLPDQITQDTKARVRVTIFVGPAGIPAIPGPTSPPVGHSGP